VRIERNPCSGKKRQKRERGPSGCWTRTLKATNVPFHDRYQWTIVYHRRREKCICIPPPFAKEAFHGVP
jgi:hypothetical protein